MGSSHERLLDRNRIPPITKLKVKFDIDELASSYQSLNLTRGCDFETGVNRSLYQHFDRLKPLFVPETETFQSERNYKQLSLTTWDPSFDLAPNEHNYWSRRSPFRKKEADERFYRRILDDVPDPIRKVIEYFQPNSHRSRFAILKPKGSVNPHIDYDTKYSLRIHIPIITSPEAILGFRHKDGKEEVFHLPADGSVYVLNQGILHWAHNGGNESRVHMIICVDTQKVLDL